MKVEAKVRLQKNPNKQKSPPIHHSCFSPTLFSIELRDSYIGNRGSQVDGTTYQHYTSAKTNTLTSV